MEGIWRPVSQRKRGLGSPRKGGNTDLLCDAFIRGAGESGNETEKICLGDRDIYYCIDCEVCRKKGGDCVYKDRDDFEEIIQKIIAADGFVIASPVYFYSLSAQMKTVIDRFFARENEIRDKTAYFITACAAPAKEYADTAVACFRGLTRCLKNTKEGGIVTGFDSMEKGSVKNKPAVQQAYEMGKNIH